jgi:hypothetical protein
LARFPPKKLYAGGRRRLRTSSKRYPEPGHDWSRSARRPARLRGGPLAGVCRLGMPSTKERLDCGVWKFVHQPSTRGRQAVCCRRQYYGAISRPRRRQRWPCVRRYIFPPRVLIGERETSQICPYATTRGSMSSSASKACSFFRTSRRRRLKCAEPWKPGERSPSSRGGRTRYQDRIPSGNVG